MLFRFNNKEYRGATATEVVEQIRRNDAEFPAGDADGGTSLQEFVARSLQKFSDRLPPREVDTSPRVGDEVQAHNYISLCHDFGIGELVE